MASIGVSRSTWTDNNTDNGSDSNDDRDSDKHDKNDEEPEDEEPGDSNVTVVQMMIVTVTSMMKMRKSLCPFLGFLSHQILSQNEIVKLTHTPSPRAEKEHETRVLGRKTNATGKQYTSTAGKQV